MRTAEELIQELDRQASKYKICTLVVALESSVVFIFTDQKDRLERLNESIKKGGEPVGMIASIKSDTSTREERLYLCTHVFKEYSDQLGGEIYLTRLLEKFATFLGRKQFDKGEWIN